MTNDFLDHLRTRYGSDPFTTTDVLEDIDPFILPAPVRRAIARHLPATRILGSIFVRMPGLKKVGTLGSSVLWAMEESAERWCHPDTGVHVEPHRGCITRYMR